MFCFVSKAQCIPKYFQSQSSDFTFDYYGAIDLKGEKK